MFLVDDDERDAELLLRAIRNVGYQGATFYFTLPQDGALFEPAESAASRRGLGRHEKGSVDDAG